ncbi:MAG: DUF1841 family protein [Burkholderiales bacterium]
MSLFHPTRDEVRGFFFSLWARSQAGEALTALESMALAIVLEHPEYHAILADPERFGERDWKPEGGESNPFLHLALHLALEEQHSIDQPPGIREALRALASRLGSEHDARHAAMECLAEALWRAQREGTGLANADYLDCLERRLRA